MVLLLGSSAVLKCRFCSQVNMVPFIYLSDCGVLVMCSVTAPLRCHLLILMSCIFFAFPRYPYGHRLTSQSACTSANHSSLAEGPLLQGSSRPLSQCPSRLLQLCHQHNTCACGSRRAFCVLSCLAASLLPLQLSTASLFEDPARSFILAVFFFAEVSFLISRSGSNLPLSKWNTIQLFPCLPMPLSHPSSAGLLSAAVAEKCLLDPSCSSSPVCQLHISLPCSQVVCRSWDNSHKLRVPPSTDLTGLHPASVTALAPFVGQLLVQLIISLALLFQQPYWSSHTSYLQSHSCSLLLSLFQRYESNINIDQNVMLSTKENLLSCHMKY